MTFVNTLIQAFMVVAFCNLATALIHDQHYLGQNFDQRSFYNGGFNNYFDRYYDFGNFGNQNQNPQCGRTLGKDDCRLFNFRSNLVTPNDYVNAIAGETRWFNVYAIEINTPATYGKCQLRYDFPTTEREFVQREQCLNRESNMCDDFTILVTLDEDECGRVVIRAVNSSVDETIYSQDISQYFWRDICANRIDDDNCAEGRYIDLVVQGRRLVDTEEGRVADLTALPWDLISADLKNIYDRDISDHDLRYVLIGKGMCLCRIAERLCYTAYRLTYIPHFPMAEAIYPPHMFENDPCGEVGDYLRGNSLSALVLATVFITIEAAYPQQYARPYAGSQPYAGSYAGSFHRPYSNPLQAYGPRPYHPYSAPPPMITFGGNIDRNPNCVRERRLSQSECHIFNTESNLVTKEEFLNEIAARGRTFNLYSIEVGPNTENLGKCRVRYDNPSLDGEFLQKEQCYSVEKQRCVDLSVLAKLTEDECGRATLVSVNSSYEEKFYSQDLSHYFFREICDGKTPEGDCPTNYYFDLNVWTDRLVATENGNVVDLTSLPWGLIVADLKTAYGIDFYDPEFRYVEIGPECPV